MKLVGRINQIERRVAAIKDEHENTVCVPTGVWHCDEDGNGIPNSGPTARVPKEQRGAFGVLLTRPPCADKEEFAAEIQRCNEYQRQLEAERTDPAESLS